MPNKKHPDRDDFDKQLAALEALGPIPKDFATIVHHRRPDWKKRYIHDVRHGSRTDLGVLAEIRRVVLENIEAKLMHPQAVSPSTRLQTIPV